MTEITLKTGRGKPAKTDLVEGEFALDVDNGTIYSKLDSGDVTALNTAEYLGVNTDADNYQYWQYKVNGFGTTNVMSTQALDFQAGNGVEIVKKGYGIEISATDTGGGNPEWDDIQNKPSEFPPSSHTHLVADITDFDPADYQPVGNYATEQYVDDAIANIDLSDASLWKQNGSDIYYNSGNVGIGTSDPRDILHTHNEAASASGIRMTNSVTGNTASDGFEVYTVSDGSGYLRLRENSHMAFGTNNTERMRIDANGRVGIGGEPGTRTAGEYLEQAKEQIASWKSTFDDRLKAEPKADKKAVTLEITDGDFGAFPTPETLAEKLAERAIGGGSALLQVAGDGYFSGTIYGKVADVADHIKAITPTQIANWDAGTGGGGGATTDGRISDTDIIHWNQAWDWGNHATAGYQPAGNYLTASSLNGYATESWVNGQGFAKGSFVPTSGNTTISGTLTASDFVATSDERLKDDISPMPVGLIDDIKPAQWTWKDSGKKSAGVIAQQLQEIGLDDFVSEGEDGMLGVNYNALTSVLLAEVIALKKQVQELSK